MLNIYGLVFWLIIDEFDYVIYFLKNSHHSSLPNKRAKVQKFLLYITLIRRKIHGYCMKFFSSAEMSPFRGVLIQCFGANLLRTAGEFTVSFFPPDYAALIWGY